MKIITAIAAATLALSTTPAFADSISVNYKDLDLLTPEGQAELDRRLDSAAREVCGLNEIQTGTRIPSRSARNCYKSAREQLDERIAMMVERERKGG